MKLPFSNAFWVIIVLLGFYAVFALLIPKIMTDQYEGFVGEVNQAQKKRLEHRLYETELGSWQSQYGSSPSIHDKVVIAARIWDLEMLKDLVAAGGDVNARESHIGMTPLMAGVGNIKVIHFLVDSGADIHLKDDRGQTALTFAIDALNSAYVNTDTVADTINYLIAKGASIHALTPTPIIFAIYNGASIGIIQLLIDKGADINTIAQNHQSALTVAAEKGRADMVSFLIEHGADLGRDAERALTLASQNAHADVVAMLSRFVTPDDKTASQTLRSAAHDGEVEMVQVLLKRFDISNGQADQALLTAIWKGHIDIVKILVESGVSVNIDNGEDTALLLSLWYKHLDIFDYLLSKGADIDAVASRYGRTALIQAAASGRVDVVKKLLAHNASQLIVDNFGNTPLMSVLGKGWHTREYDRLGAEMSRNDAEIAAISKDLNSSIIEIFHMLLENKPVINKQNKKGDTASLIAMKNHLSDLIPDLLKNQADVTIKNKQDESLMLFASRQLNFNLILLLIDHGEDVNFQANHSQDTALMGAVRQGNINVVRALLKRGADTNIYAFSHTALDIVPDDRINDIGTLILASGADVNSVSYNGETPLMRSISKGDFNRSKWLVASGADVNFQQKSRGDTPLHYATSPNKHDFIVLLLDNGADPYIKNRVDISPYYLAIFNPDTFRIFTERDFKIPVNDPHFLEYALSQNNAPLFLYLLANGADPNVKLKQYQSSILFRAIAAKKEVLAKELIMHGADVDFVYQKGSMTTLMAAISAGLSPDMIQLIVNNTEYLNAKAYSAGSFVLTSALDLATNLKRNDIVVLLKKAGGKTAEVKLPEKTLATSKKLAKQFVTKFLKTAATGQCKKASNMITQPFWVDRTYWQKKNWLKNCANMGVTLSKLRATDVYYPKDSDIFMHYARVDSILNLDLQKAILVDVTGKSVQRGWSFILSCTAYQCKIIGFADSPLKNR